MKNKKIRKKLYIKIEKRQRSIRRPKKGGGGLSFGKCGKRQTIHAQNGRIVFVFAFCGFKYARIMQKLRFCSFSGGMLAFICVCGLFAAAVFAFGEIVFVLFAAKYTLNVCKRNGRSLLFIPLRVFCFPLSLSQSCFHSLLSLSFLGFPFLLPFLPLVVVSPLFL